MASYRIIDDYNIGDTYRLTRTLDSVPTGGNITDAWFAVKSDMNMPDSLANFNVHITTNVTTSGIVINNADGSALIQFVVPGGTYGMVPNATYFYDVVLKTSAYEDYTVEMGKLFTGYNVNQIY